MNASEIKKNCSDPSQEDYRTVDIFGNLSKLSDLVLLCILGNCCIGRKFYKCVCGALKHFEFWPRWNCNKRLNCVVEPDVLMRFTNVDLIVEVKRNDHVAQIHEQLEKELLAYEEIYGHENKTVILLALGGEDLPFEVFLDDHPVLNAMIFYCSWRKFRSVVEDISKNQEIDNYSDRLILEEIVKSLEYYGFRYERGIDELLNSEKYEIGGKHEN